MAIEDLIAKRKAARGLVTPVTRRNYLGITRSRCLKPLQSLENVPAVTPVTPKNDLTADAAASNERAAVLEFDCGLQRAEAERQVATEQGFPTADALFAAVANGWAAHLCRLQASQRSLRGRPCITLALAFIEDGWALEALRLGWSELELVGTCPVAPWERLDRLGAAYAEGRAIELTPEAIFYRSSDKTPLRLLRASQADGARLPWERL